MLSQLIADEQGEYPLDLRAGKSPFTHKDNDVFAINDLDGVYDYIEGSKEWFVDIYASTIIDKYPHADFTGSALTSTAFEEALKREPMTAREKFEARLGDLGLWEEWCQQGRCGRIATTTDYGIIILCNEGTGDDNYTESLYPHISTMQKDDNFRLNALSEFCGHGDNQFVYDLCMWVARPNEYECPLFPVDVYFIWDNPSVTFFKDDQEPASVAEYVFAKQTEEHCIDCGEDVMLSQELKVQKCPNCGRWIVPCSACPLEHCQHPCPLERFASILNR